ncbi:hypothetical protein HAU32_06770 [Weissella confusa]|uniref:Uncharacterized protein n=1 Tax=Weissella fermenti TaxID=2987699 RepID=A0ABT6D4L7_9LACO|nr:MULTISPECIES: hypothetical protein [Weissella]MBJ7688676.1 hypothetical protein [Weissella confusa]MCW0925990.1 hypothetical protein [Weissella sp. LMG 11983]MDF9300460.1 hypothetical protein [Weissella sp. BK2]
MSKQLTGFKGLLYILVLVSVGPIILAVIGGDNIWQGYPWGVVATVAASFLYLTNLNEVLLTLLIYLAWLVAIVFFKNDLIFPKFIIQAILAGFMTGFSAMLGIYAKNHK